MPTELRWIKICCLLNIVRRKFFEKMTNFFSLFLSKHQKMYLKTCWKADKGSKALNLLSSYFVAITLEFTLKRTWKFCTNSKSVLFYICFLFIRKCRCHLKVKFDVKNKTNILLKILNLIDPNFKYCKTKFDFSLKCLQINLFLFWWFSLSFKE